MLIYLSSSCSICFSHFKCTNYNQQKCRDEKAHPEHKEEQLRSPSQQRTKQHENIQTNWAWCLPFLPSLHFSVDIHILLQNSYQTHQLISIAYHKERYLGVNQAGTLLLNRADSRCTGKSFEASNNFWPEIWWARREPLVQVSTNTAYCYKTDAADIV